MERSVDKYNIKELEEKNNRCKNIKFEDINPDDVDETSSIKIDRRKWSNKLIFDFLTQVKNPYVFKVNGKLVRMIFSESSPTSHDCLARLLKIYIGN